VPCWSTPEPIFDRARTALVIVAHPDDETLGAASLLFRHVRCRMIHVTDGAPRDPRFRSDTTVSRERYARARRTELFAALAIAGIEAGRSTSLGVPDMETIECLDATTKRLAADLASLRPDLVVTHDYAGGHPDHDAVAWAVAAACQLLIRCGGQPPVVYEMALYHGEGGQFHFGEFPSQRAGAEPIVLALSAAERHRKQSMLDAFVSQRGTLPLRELTVERFRRASTSIHEFARAPHDGPLLYERWGFPITGEHWRTQAVRAARRLAVDGGDSHD
jgi:LmbE family N-acetylglucosaminyl deacetylase